MLYKFCLLWATVLSQVLLHCKSLTRLVVICGCMRGSLQTRSDNNILCMGKATYYVDDCSR